MEDTLIHPSSVISLGASLGPDVRVDAFAVIGDEVRIGAGTRIGPHSVIEGPTEIGENNRIFGQASIGRDPQDLKYRGEKSFLYIGDDNRIREFVTIHRGTEAGGGETVVGSGNLLMTGVHIAHDCKVGNGVIMGNAATLAGHVEVDDNSNIGAFSGVHQFCRVGYRSFVGGYSVITRDTLPFVKTVGTRGNAGIFGINTVGLARAGFSEERIGKLKQAYRFLFRAGLTIDEAVAQIEKKAIDSEDVRVLIDFIRDSEKGFVR